MAAAASGMPPVPPDVLRQMQAAQQRPPVAQFAQNYQQPQQAAPQQDPTQMDGNQVADQLLTEAAGTLKKVAQAVSQTAPQLMPILQKMLEAGASLQKELQALTQGEGGGNPALAPGAQAPGGAGAVSMS